MTLSAYMYAVVLHWHKNEQTPHLQADWADGCITSQGLCWSSKYVHVSIAVVLCMNEEENSQSDVGFSSCVFSVRGGGAVEALLRCSKRIDPLMAIIPIICSSKQ